MRAVFLCTIAFAMLTGCRDRAKLDALEVRVQALEKLSEAAADGSDDGFVALVSETKGYQIIQAGTGPILVKVVDISPYLDGFKLRLAIGNLQSVTYSRCKVHLRWAGRTKEEIVSTALLPAHWTAAEIILTPASAEEARSLQIAVNPMGITMLERKSTGGGL
jgi:hypothetical protein